MNPKCCVDEKWLFQKRHKIWENCHVRIWARQKKLLKVAYKNVIKYAQLESNELFVTCNMTGRFKFDYPGTTQQIDFCPQH